MSVLDTPNPGRAESAGQPETADQDKRPASTKRSSRRGSGSSPLDRTGAGTRIVILVVLVLALLWTLVPLVWMVLSSFKPATAITSAEPSWLFTPTGEHYAGLFTGETS